MIAQEASGPRVFLIRHGETEWSKSGRSTGTTDIELTHAGTAQIIAAATMLVGTNKLVDPNRLIKVFVSPRKRARETFNLFLASSSHQISKDVIYTDEIAECSRKERGLDLGSSWDIYSDGCEGGESPEKITERLDGLITRIKEIQKPYLHGEQPADVLLVAHGLILRCFWKRWLGFPINTEFPMVYDPGEIAVLCYKNGSINEPAFHPGISLPCESRADPSRTIA